VIFQLMIAEYQIRKDLLYGVLRAIRPFIDVVPKNEPQTKYRSFKKDDG